jgi:16S rRNA G966 N2-methylase RsmD
MCEQIDFDEEINSGQKNTYLYTPKILSNFNTSLYFNIEDIKKIEMKRKEGNDVKLMLTDKGIYSISKPIDAEWIIKCIKKTVTNINELIITDSTAGLGGNTICFSKHFKKVNGIEINDIHFFVLKNNISVLELNNVKLIKDNYLNQIDKIEEDIVFIDPPWGGKKYHYIKYFNIRLGKVPICKIINILFNKNVKYVVLKCPYNTNVTDILRESEYDNCNVFKSDNIWLLIFY